MSTFLRCGSAAKLACMTSTKIPSSLKCLISSSTYIREKILCRGGIKIMITRGTTPYHSFLLPMKSEEISEIYITYLQNNVVVLDLTGERITIEDISNEYENASMEETDEEVEDACEATVHLTQEETLLFKFYPAAEKNIAVIQIRILTTEGEAFASEPVHERIFGVLKEGVIGE